IMEYLVNINKRHAFWSLNEDILKITDSENQYAVFIKKDTVYLCLHSPKTTKETRSIRRIQRRPIRRIEDIKVRMTKVINGEFEKLEDLKVKDVSLTCDTPLEFFNNEFNRLSGMDDNLFTYEFEVANILCDSNKDDDSEQRMSHGADDDMGYDPSDVAFTEWLGGDDEVELTDEESFDNDDEVAKTYLLRTLRDSRLMKNIRMIGYMWKKDIPWVDEKPWTDTRVWKEPKPVKHTCKPFNYKTGCLEWPTCSWKNDGYYNGGNLSGAYIVGNSLHYRDYEWYEALKKSEQKEQALRNKAIMKGLISDDKSCNDVCNIRRFEMIKYSFGQDEEYVAVKEDEYDNLARTNDDACRAYQEIFRMMDEGWMVTRAE
ncbi:hypothetical protein Tco_1021208, partial [Tanacetum coccineum]